MPGRLLQVLIPGAGHIAQDRPGRGLVLFFLFLLFLNAVVFPDLYPIPRVWARPVGAAGAAAIWIWAAVEFLRGSSRNTSGE